MWTLSSTSRLFLISSLVSCRSLRTFSTTHRHCALSSDSMRFIWVCDSTGGRQFSSRAQQGEENCGSVFHRRRVSRLEGKSEQMWSAWWQQSSDWERMSVWRHWQSRLGWLSRSLLTWAIEELRPAQGGARMGCHVCWDRTPVVARMMAVMRRSVRTVLTEPSIAHWTPHEHLQHLKITEISNVFSSFTGEPLRYPGQTFDNNQQLYQFTFTIYSRPPLYFLSTNIQELIPSHSHHITIFL